MGGVSCLNWCILSNEEEEKAKGEVSHLNSYKNNRTERKSM